MFIREIDEQGKLRTVKVIKEPHTDSIEFISFNHNNTLMATGGLSNKIKVWDVAKGYELKFELEGPTEDIFFMVWHPKGNVLLTGGKDFLVWMFNCNNGQYM